MAQEGIIQINNGKLQESVVPRRNVSVDVALYRVLVLWPFDLYVGLGTSVSIDGNTLQYSLLLHNYITIFTSTWCIYHVGDAAISVCMGWRCGRHKTCYGHRSTSGYQETST